MDLGQLRQDVAKGTIEVDRWVDVIHSQQKIIRQQQARVEKLQEENKKLREKNPTEQLDEPFSEKAEEKRQAKAKGVEAEVSLPSSYTTVRCS